MALKLASASAAALSVTVQVGAVPRHAPDQPENMPLPSGCAVSVTTVPAGCVVLQLMLVQVLDVPLTVAMIVPGPTLK